MVGYDDTAVRGFRLPTLLIINLWFLSTAQYTRIMTKWICGKITVKSLSLPLSSIVSLPWTWTKVLNTDELVLMDRVRTVMKVLLEATQRAEVTEITRLLKTEVLPLSSQMNSNRLRTFLGLISTAGFNSAKSILIGDYRFWDWLRNKNIKWSGGHYANKMCSPFPNQGGGETSALIPFNSD